MNSFVGRCCRHRRRIERHIEQQFAGLPRQLATHGSFAFNDFASLLARNLSHLRSASPDWDTAIRSSYRRLFTRCKCRLGIRSGLRFAPDDPGVFAYRNRASKTRHISFHVPALFGALLRLAPIINGR